MKIIFVEEITLAKRLTHSKSMGGIETTTWDDINEMRARGHEVMINNPFPDGSKPDLVASSTYGPIAQWLLYKYKTKYKCACIQHAHTTVEDLQGGFIPKQLAFINKWVPAYIRKLYSYAHLIITPTEFSKKCLKRAGVQKIIYALSSGIHMEPLKGGSENRANLRKFLKEKYHVAEDTFVVANVGYTWERKGIDRFYYTAKKMPHVFFLWTGPKIASKYLLAAEKLPNCGFPGFYPDIRDVYYGADAFFFPSYVENLGLPIIEASMCHLPVIASTIEAFDWIPNKTHALKGDTPEEYQKAIQFYMDYPCERKAIANRACELAIDLHAFQNIGPRLEKLYYKALDLKEIYHNRYHIL